jgi:hypothetical protein
VGPASAQALVEWRLGECGDKFIGVCTEAKSVWELKRLFCSFTEGIRRSLRMTEFGTYQGASTISRKNFD